MGTGVKLKNKYVYIVESWHIQRPSWDKASHKYRGKCSPVSTDLALDVDTPYVDPKMLFGYQIEFPLTYLERQLNNSIVLCLDIL